MLKLSARVEYAILIVHFLRKSRDKRFSISDVSENLGIPNLIARKITKELAVAKIIYSFQGRNGGIQAVDIGVSVYDVIHALGEDFSLVPCISEKGCESSHICEMSRVFHRMNQSLESLMKLTKL